MDFEPQNSRDSVFDLSDLLEEVVSLSGHGHTMSEHWRRLQSVWATLRYRRSTGQKKLGETCSSRRLQIPTFLSCGLFLLLLPFVVGWTTLHL